MFVTTSPVLLLHHQIFYAACFDLWQNVGGHYWGCTIALDLRLNMN